MNFISNWANKWRFCAWNYKFFPHFFNDFLLSKDRDERVLMHLRKDFEIETWGIDKRKKKVCIWLLKNKEGKIASYLILSRLEVDNDGNFQMLFSVMYMHIVLKLFFLLFVFLSVFFFFLCLCFYFLTKQLKSLRNRKLTVISLHQKQLVKVVEEKNWVRN